MSTTRIKICDTLGQIKGYWHAGLCKAFAAPSSFIKISRSRGKKTDKFCALLLQKSFFWMHVTKTNPTALKKSALKITDEIGFVR